MSLNFYYVLYTEHGRSGTFAMPSAFQSMTTTELLIRCGLLLQCVCVLWQTVLDGAFVLVQSYLSLNGIFI